MTNRLAAALAYAKAGYRVFPVRPGQKQPAFKAWPERATGNPNIILGWWRRTGFNIGVATGDLVVLDFDDAPQAERFVAVQHPILRTIVITRRGQHIYCRANGRAVRNSARAEHFCDIRAYHGYVLGESSIVDGHEYCFLDGHELVPVSELPLLQDDWLPPSRVVRRRPSQSIAPATPRKLRRARTYLSMIRCVSTKRANAACYRACCQLIDLFGVSESELRLLIEDWNQTNCFAEDGVTPYPWSAEEIDRKIAAALSREFCP